MQVQVQVRGLVWVGLGWGEGILARVAKGFVNRACRTCRGFAGWPGIQETVMEIVKVMDEVVVRWADWSRWAGRRNARDRMTRD